MRWEKVTVEELEREAAAIAGISDFGDPGYRAGLHVLLGEFETNPRLSEAGAAAARSMVVGLLTQRLLAQSRLNGQDSPPSIRAPWIIVSMPRSGTTALHRMLCADPEAQGLTYWLGQYPQPRPPRDTWPENPDYRAKRHSFSIEQELLHRPVRTPAVRQDVRTNVFDALLELVVR